MVNYKIKETVEKRDWNEFRKTGLFMFINTILHAFGWAIVVEVDNYKELGDEAPVTNVYPARVKFRGFGEIEQTDMHERIADYLSKTAPNFPEEIK